MPTPDELAATLRLTPEAVARRLAAIGLSAADRADLRHASEAIGPGIEPFLEALYRRFQDFPETAVLLASAAQVDRLKAHQRRYLAELTRADIDWAYVLRRLTIGLVHHRVRLAPQWYLPTYAHFLVAHLEPVFRSAPNAAAGHRRINTLIRTAFFDASLALDAYGWSVESAIIGGPTEAPPEPGPDGEAPAAAGAAAPARDSLIQVRATADDVARRRQFVGLDDSDLALLRSLRQVVEASTPGMLDDFYHFFSANAETAKLVPPETVTRLKTQVASYWSELVSGSFDRPYAASRIRIGVVHEKVGLGPEWYLAGLARQLTAHLENIAARYPGDLRSVAALIKAVFFDVAFVIDAYMDARAETLLRAEGYASQLVADLGSAVAVLDPADRVVSANPTLAAMAGGDPATLYLMPVDRLLPIPEIGRIVREYRRGGSDRVRGLGRSGERHFRITAMGLAGPQLGEGTAAVLVDEVSDLIRLGNDMDRRTDHFEQLADRTGAVMWEADPQDWTITLINGASRTLTGYRDVDFLGRPGAWLNLVTAEDRGRLTELARALEPGQQTEIEYLALRADHREVRLRTRLAKVARPEPKLVALTVDSTVPHRLTMLRLEAIGTLAGGVAHFVNNSLARVLGNVEMDALDQGGWETAPRLKDAADAIRQTAGMVAKLLAFAGRQPLRPAVISVAEACRAAVPRLEALVGPTIRLSLTADSAWQCRLDPAMFTTTLEALAANARQAISGGARSPSPFATSRAARSRRRTKISDAAGSKSKSPTPATG